MIEQYLARLASRLTLPAAERGRVIDEARDHLLEAIAAETALGASAEEAARRAVRRFGSPAVVARKFNRELGPRPTPLRWLGAFIRRRSPVTETNAPEFKCSFCGKSREQVRRLIAGPNFVYICSGCVALCNEIIAREEGAPQPSPA